MCKYITKKTRNAPEKQKGVITKNRILSEENKELQKYKHQINTINEFDRIKQQLIQINPYTKFKYLIIDKRYKSRLEEVFNAPFDQIEKKYRKLLYERNDLCHPYTSRYW
ncbi:hypothetical protein Plhal304r1_c034g0106301 [Plasmopara halstedii]